MAALNVGTVAPDFTLHSVGKETISLSSILAKGPVVLAFFKVSCPVCQFAFPFLERVHQASGGGRATVLGVSQDGGRDTQAFLRQLGVSFPVLLDEPRTYPVSNAYGITHVPTVFYIGANGEVEVSSVGWSKSDVETMNEKLAAHRKERPSELWKSGEVVHDFQMG